MKGLAIDTSNLVMGVATIDGNQITGELITNLKKNHSVRLMPAIEQLMNEVDMSPKDLNRVIVANGPGSYTGVRIGVSIAKTLAWSLQIPIVGVSGLEVLAQNGEYFNGYVSPIFDARRGQVYTGLYGFQAGYEETEKDRIVMMEDWLKLLQEKDEPILFIGNDTAIHEKMIQDILGDQAVFASSSKHNPRPAELARLGMEKTPEEDIHTFVPDYLRLAEAEAKWLASQKK